MQSTLTERYVLLLRFTFIVMAGVLERGSNGGNVLTLHDICLKFVSKNIRELVEAFFTETEKHLKFRLNLKDIQYLYTPYLLKESERWAEMHGRLGEYHLKFLLNEHIRKINLCPNDGVIFSGRMMEIGHVRHDVNINLDVVLTNRPGFEEVKEFVNVIMHYLSNVKMLNLAQYGGDSTLQIISLKCLELEILLIDGSSVTNNGLKSLCPSLLEQNLGAVKYPNLKYLSLLHVRDVNEGVRYLLQNMPSLEVIKYEGLATILYELIKRENLVRSYKLTSIDMYGDYSPGGNLIDVLKSFVITCPDIKQLSLSLKTKEELNLCLQFSKLEDFSVESASKLDFNEFISKKGMLRNLYVENFKLSVPVLIRYCPKLDYLSLKYVEFQDFNYDINLEPLNNLKKLILAGFDLRNENIQNSVIYILNSSLNRNSNETLNELLLFTCEIDSKFLKLLLNTCSNLKKFTCSDCHDIIDDEIRDLEDSFKNIKINFYNDYDM